MDPFHKLEFRVRPAGIASFRAYGYYGEVEGGTGTPGARTSIDPEGQKKRQKKLSIPEHGGKAGRAPEQTFEEIRYLKHLIENATSVRVKMEDGRK